MKPIDATAKTASRRNPPLSPALGQARSAIDDALSRDRGRLHGLWSRWRGRPDDAAMQAAFEQALTDAKLGGQKAAVTAATPLWLYVLREAEFHDGRLGPVGGRIVAEVFHRAIEGSRTSIVREPSWRPEFGPDAQTFRMTDLLLFAFAGKADLLNPLGD